MASLATTHASLVVVLRNLTRRPDTAFSDPSKALIDDQLDQAQRGLPRLELTHPMGGSGAIAWGQPISAAHSPKPAHRLPTACLPHHWRFRAVNSP